MEMNPIKVFTGAENDNSHRASDMTGNINKPWSGKKDLKRSKVHVPMIWNANN